MNAIFYKAKYSGFLGKAVALFSYGPYSHVELQFSNGTCFSSSYCDNGVRFKYIDIKSERWDVVPLSDHLDERMVGAICRIYDGMMYDILGVLGFPIRFTNVQCQYKWYCSEISAHVLRMTGIEEYAMIPKKISPIKLYEILTGDTNARA